MQPETQKYLYDIRQACEALLDFIRDKSLQDYNDDLLLRSGVERQLMIIGEALNQAYKIDPALSETLSNIREIINLRNVIVHGYAFLENETIWGILEDDLPQIIQRSSNVIKARVGHRSTFAL